MKALANRFPTLLTLLALLALPLMVSCGGSSGGSDSTDDFGDIDDIVIDDSDDSSDSDDRDDTADNDDGDIVLVTQYTKGVEMPRKPLHPKYLTRSNLYEHLKPELSTEAVEYNINNRLPFDTKLFFPKLCLYRDVKLVDVGGSTFRYDTDYNGRCKPDGSDITRYQERERGQIRVSSRHKPKAGQTLGELWFDLLKKIADGEPIDIEHTFTRTELMDYRDSERNLRRIRLMTQSSGMGSACEFEFNGAFAGQEFSPCVRQMGVRIWDRDSGENGINDFVKLENPSTLTADQNFESQRWFNEGSGLRIEVNSWKGTLTFDQAPSKNLAPLASLRGPGSKSLEFRPNPRPNPTPFGGGLMERKMR